MRFLTSSRTTVWSLYDSLLASETNNQSIIGPRLSICFFASSSSHPSNRAREHWAFDAPRQQYRASGVLELAARWWR